MRKQTVFIVDDSTTNLMVGSDALSGKYNVFTLDSGARLFKMLERNIPDLILLDIEMPEMSGHEIIRRIKEQAETRSVPVIFLTAHNDAESELEGLSLGAADYISKPFSPPLLRKRVEMHLLVESQKRELTDYSTNLEKMVEARTKTITELQSAVLTTMSESVEFRDGITGAHIERTQEYLGILLRALLEKNLYEEEISLWNMEIVLQSAQLHDVGKIAIPDSILKKPGKLTCDEFEIIKEHVTYGEKIIGNIQKKTTEQKFLSYAKIVSGAHHERWDGTGYPRGLRGTEIPLLGRIMAIADVYDALVSDRPYKKVFPHKKAVAIIMSEKGTHFDPVLTDMFFEVSDRFEEVGKLHELNAGGA